MAFLRLLLRRHFARETSGAVAGNVGYFLRLTTNSPTFFENSSKGTRARKKANLATRGARQERRDLTFHFDKIQITFVRRFVAVI